MIKFIIISLITMVMVSLAYYLIIMDGDFPHPDNHSFPQEFPYYKQPDQISCGPASITMLLNYYGKDTKFEQAKKHAKTKWFKYGNEEIGMTSPDYIKITLDHFGVSSRLKTATISEIKHYISRNRFPIVLLRSSKKTWHYVVAIGYSETHITLADPAFGKSRNLTLETFENAWKFSHDMKGNEIATRCPICKGDGTLLWIPQPLGECDTCSGLGHLPDVYALGLRLADIPGYTLIVPDSLLRS